VALAERSARDEDGRVTVRFTLKELRRELVDLLDDEWQTATDLQHQLGLGGSDWYSLCLALERLANDGAIEMCGQGTRVRRFRRYTTYDADTSSAGRRRP
jgi:hypothetical protein